jgi:hypothetical protein
MAKTLKKIDILDPNPFMFEGTLRKNIDPNDQFTDEQIIEVLSYLFVEPVAANYKGVSLRESELLALSADDVNNQSHNASYSANPQGILKNLVYESDESKHQESHFKPAKKDAKESKIVLKPERGMSVDSKLPKVVEQNILREESMNSPSIHTINEERQQALPLPESLATKTDLRMLSYAKNNQLIANETVKNPKPMFEESKRSMPGFSIHVVAEMEQSSSLGKDILIYDGTKRTATVIEAILEAEEHILY